MGLPFRPEFLSERGLMVELLRTKLFIPQARANLVPRPRLVERLNTGLDKKLTLIVVPGGFGKTTLVSARLKQVDHPAALSDLPGGSFLTGDRADRHTSP